MSNGIDKNPLLDISKVYLNSVAESAVPGKPAEKLGAVTTIPKSEQEAAKERLLAKAKAKRAATWARKHEEKKANMTPQQIHNHDVRRSTKNTPYARACEQAGGREKLLERRREWARLRKERQQKLTPGNFLLIFAQFLHIFGQDRTSCICQSSGVRKVHCDPNTGKAAAKVHGER